MFTGASLPSSCVFRFRWCSCPANVAVGFDLLCYGTARTARRDGLSCACCLLSTVVNCGLITRSDALLLMRFQLCVLLFVLECPHGLFWFGAGEAARPGALLWRCAYDMSGCSLQVRRRVALSLLNCCVSLGSFAGPVTMRVHIFLLCRAVGLRFGVVGRSYLWFQSC